MTLYYLSLSLSRFRQRIGTHIAIALMLGAGVGTAMVMLSIVLQASSDPVPGRSASLFRPQLDVRPGSQQVAAPDRGQGLTWPDAKALLDQGRAWNQAAMAGGAVTLLKPGRSSARLRARYATSGVFSVLGIGLVQGRSWTAEEGQAGSRVVVLSRSLAAVECPAGCSGQSLELSGRTYTVVGVAEDWHPVPMFQGDVTRRPFVEPDQIYLPVETAIADGLTVVDGVTVWGGGEGVDLAGLQASWLQLWAWLPTVDDVSGYRAMLNAYAQARDLQVDPGNDRVGLWPLMAWLDRQGLVPEGTRTQLRLALLLLVVCIVNAAALLGFSLGARRRELAIRRALGARRGDVFAQLMWESASSGLASAALAAIAYAVGMRLVAAGEVLPSAITALDPTSVLMAAAVGFATALVCALIPALEICRAGSLSRLFAKGAA
ncbi:TPA: ABC transporter permease [Stenotrophomonas maltophilia]|nr:ABC transporter permease [Stenotrophomonas maltophilia]HDS1024484.1 ABC transporter permease [Stenotrophomonas maltophilia]HDS1029216.1 ABC transporter permease [Stenotrophomonas maltophilia]HDS1033849.1 ABC transporter permease [Stenotrophomonas maltophilia]